MDSRKYNSLFQCPSKERAYIVDGIVVEYFEVYVEPNLKKLFDANDSINIMTILNSQIAVSDKRFAEYIDSEFKQHGREFKSVLMVLRRLFYGDLEGCDPLMMILINNDKTLGMKKLSLSEYNLIIKKVMRSRMCFYFQREIPDISNITNNGW